MPTLNVAGQSVNVDDSFLKLSPDEQNSTVDEIAQHLKGAQPAPTTSSMDQAGIDFQNQGYAATQGTTPVMSAQSPNLVSDDVGMDDAGNAVYKDPATGQQLQADSSKHVVLRDPNDGKLKVYARSDDTNEGALSSLGRMLGLGMGAGPMAVEKVAPAAVSAADRLGVAVPKAIMTDSPFVRLTGQAVAKAPGGGTLGTAIDQSRQGLQGAVSDAAKLAGGSTDPAVAGDNFADAIENSFKPQVKSGLSAAYDNVSSMMDPNVTTPLENTQSAVANIMARRGASAIDGTGKAVDAVTSAITRPGGLTFDGIKGLRTSVGEMLDSGVFPEGMSEGELRQIYGGLSEDLKTAAQAAGGDRGLAAFQRANEFTKQVSDWKDGLKKIIGPSTRSGEGISGAIIRMASDGPSADIETLAKARNAVPKEVWSDIASTAIGQMGMARNKVWTPAAFATDFRGLSDRGRALLFRSVGSGDVLPYLDDIAKVSQKFVDAGKLANTSGTAGHEALMKAGAVAFGGAAVGSWKEPLGVLGFVAGVNGLSRLLASPATAASAARWSRAYAGFARAQTPAAKAVLGVATKNLASTASSYGVNLNPTEILRLSSSPQNADAETGQNDVPGAPTSQ